MTIKIYINIKTKLDNKTLSKHTNFKATFFKKRAIVE